MTLESLIKDDELITTIKDLVRESGRSHPRGRLETQPKSESGVSATEKQQVANGKEKTFLGMQKDPLAVHS